MRILIKNRKATHEYEILEKYVAGISLLGAETKSIMMGNCSLTEGYVVLRGGEAFLTQVHISRYTKIDGFSDNINERRDRKLLLLKSEIKKLGKAVAEKGLTIVPLSLQYSDTKKIKVEIAICKGKKLYDKRHDLKKKQLDLDAKRAYKD
jgi:SsrA-binding protein